MQTNIVPEEITGVNFKFQKTSRGPLMQLSNNGLVCLLASAETRTAQMIKGIHTDIFKKHFNKDGMETVLNLQEEWRSNQQWTEVNGIIFMNGMPAYRILDKTLSVSKEWFELTRRSVNRMSKPDSLNSLREEFNTFIDSISFKGTVELLDWWRGEIDSVNEAIDNRLAKA